ncbi:MAG: hypothetical protein GYA36_22985 [Veillonellaceae bacterium]|nr:hypothetical protein [Veillonellaceae bacterium]
MSTFVGLNQCAEFDIAGTGPFVAFDEVTGGRIGSPDNEPAETDGIGGQSLKVRPMVEPAGNATTVVQSIGLISCIKPAAVGNLPTLIKKIQGGGIGDEHAANLQTDCYLSSLKLSCEVGGLLLATYEWLALDEESVAITSPAAKQTNSPVAWHTGSVFIDGAAYKCIGWEVTATTGIAQKTSLDAKTAGSQRMPEWMEPGPFQVSLSARFRLPLGIDLRADRPDAIGFKFTGQDAGATPKTFTLDLTGGDKLDPGASAAELVASADEAVWSLTAKSTKNDLAVWACTFAAS